MQHRRAWLYAIAYLFIGLLFIIKYSVRYDVSPFATGLGYTVFVFGAGVLLLRRPWWYVGWNRRHVWAGVMLIAALLLFTMLQFDPTVIRNARHGLLNQSVELLLHGSFPWGEPIHAHHSAFPFWFALTIPFYLLGDVGLLLIAGFLLMGLVMVRIAHRSAAAGIALLVVSPAFLYEIATRSGITTNMILVMAYLMLAERVVNRNSYRSIFLIGLLGGLVLSTRGVVLLVFLAYFSYLMQNNKAVGFAILSGWLLSFTATIVPFMLWDFDRFWTYGPFPHQLALTHLNGWIITALVITAFWFGQTLRTWQGVFEICGWLLFFGVTTSFGLTVSEHGWATAIMDSRFDISYFCFSLPLLIVGWTRHLPGEKLEISPEK